MLKEQIVSIMIHTLYEHISLFYIVSLELSVYLSTKPRPYPYSDQDKVSLASSAF